MPPDEFTQDFLPEELPIDSMQLPTRFNQSTGPAMASLPVRYAIWSDLPLGPIDGSRFATNLADAYIEATTVTNQLQRCDTDNT